MTHDLPPLATDEAKQLASDLRKALATADVVEKQLKALGWQVIRVHLDDDSRRPASGMFNDVLIQKSVSRFERI